MRVLWTHNFDPAQANSQVYMNTAAAGVRAAGIDLELEYLGNLRSLATLAAARRRVNRLARGFDLVHAQYGSACALATAGVEGPRKVVSIRGNDWNVHDESFGFFYLHTRAARAMTRLALGAFDGIAAVSRRLAGALAPIAPRAQVMTLPSPIDLARFVPRDKAASRAQLGEPSPDDKWILFTALNTADPIKRFRLAQEAFARASARRGGLRFRVASTLAHDDVPLFVAACDLILCTSETEGWPNSVKEALACDVPFVSTDVSDLAAIALVEPACRVCPPDAEALATAMCEVLAMPAPAGLRRHVASMDLDASTAQLIRFYESILAGAPALKAVS